MLLKKITLENIRSYKNQEIDFCAGSTLLAGDIGCGKTSILLAIEFALFGLQPGQRGSSLLRNGEEHAKVIIEFELRDKKITVERTLKKAKTVSQDYCSIAINGKKTETSVTELKDKVLELLNYPKEFSKKQNILYKFTVYTPQEEMKQIILQDSVTRLNTLRHVFGIDKYKKILENTSLIAQKIREEKRLKEGMTLNLEHDKKLKESKETELEIKNQNLISYEKEFFIKLGERKIVQQQKDETFLKIEEKNKLKAEVEKTKIMTSTKKESVLSNEKTIELLKNQIEDLHTLNFNESQIKEFENKIFLLKAEKNKFAEQNIQLNSRIASLNLRNDELKKLEDKFANLDICPTCLQDVDAIYRANILNKSRSDSSSNISNIKELEFEKNKLIKKLQEIDSEISEKEKQATELKILKMKLEGAKEKQLRIMELEKTNNAMNQDIELLIKHIDSLRNSVFELGKYDGIYEKKQKDFELSQNQEKFAEIKVAELKKEIEVYSYSIKELEEKIEQTEKIKKQLNYLTELEDWLSSKFTNMISRIEKNVMIKLKSEFSQLFNEWFAMLVSDSFNVRLDEDFTPIIEQQDYEIDYAYLSGGERTAIALAYRLSLNQVINSLMSKIKTRNLVILDEPTDGFSEQQLDKMRDVLAELNVEQLIIVSHEQKIEGFVENVIRFKKENGISEVMK